MLIDGPHKAGAARVVGESGASGRARSLAVPGRRPEAGVTTRRRSPGRRRTCAVLLLVLALCGLTRALPCRAFGIPDAGEFHNTLSLQGFTGVLNTPSAHVTEEGSLYGLYTNQKESTWRAVTPYQDNYLLSLGFFSFAELGARLTARPGSNNRDLSANVKLTSAPLSKGHPLLPVLALGMQDVAGGAKLLQTKYLVASEDLWRFRFSAGYGTGPSRMHGVFGGVEFKAQDWLYLLADYDTSEKNVGARLVTPRFRNFPVQFTATAKTSLDNRPGNFEFAAGFTLPLDFRAKGPAPSPQQSAPDMVSSEPGAPERTQDPGQDERGPATPIPGLPGQPKPEAQPLEPAQRTPALAKLRDRLVREGFLNVRVGVAQSGTLVVEYENARFHHNELDGLGVVAGIAARQARGRYEQVQLIAKRHDIPILSFSAPQRALEGFLAGNLAAGSLNQALEIHFDAAREQVDFLPGAANPGFLKTSLVLAPALTTFIGTEHGVFDYQVSLQPELLVDAWRGGVLDARGNVPVAWSKNLDDGGAYRDSRNRPQLDRLMFFQAWKPLPGLMANLGAGMLTPDRYGTLNEAAWSPGDGSHRFRVVQSYDKESSTQKVSTVYLGSYRYYLSRLDLSLEASAGKFWGQDTGGRLELRRFFGDTSVALFYTNTEGADRKKWQSAGVQFTLPLTPRREMKHLASLQLRGSDEWSYTQASTLKNHNTADARGSLNYLAPYPLALDPLPATALYREYGNRDRLSEAYLREHLEIMKDAWKRYGDHP